MLLCHTLVAFKIYVFLMSDLSSLRSFSQSLWSINVTVYEEESISWIKKFPSINKNKCCSSTSPGSFSLSHSQIVCVGTHRCCSLSHHMIFLVLCPKTKFNFSFTLHCTQSTEENVFFRSRINRMEGEKERERNCVHWREMC